MPTYRESQIEAQERSACSRCRMLFDIIDLKHASIPPINSIIVAANAEPDDLHPLPLPLDQLRYCQACLRNVHRQRFWRIFATIFIGLIAVAAATSCLRWLGW